MACGSWKQTIVSEQLVRGGLALAAQLRGPGVGAVWEREGENEGQRRPDRAARTVRSSGFGDRWQRLASARGTLQAGGRRFEPCTAHLNDGRRTIGSTR